MTRTTFRAGFETLERRETMSTTAMAAAYVRHNYPVSGTGTGQVTSLTTLPGSVTASGNLQGNSPSYGAFTGVVSVVGSTAPGNRAHGTAALFAGGSELDLGLTGTFRLPTRAGVPARGNFHFTVTGGTGLGAGATGNGNISGTLDTTTGVFQFSFRGKLRY